MLCRIHEPRAIDHQKMKERLGEIVRNKEGYVWSLIVKHGLKIPFQNERKMVNVNVQIPFNLHNQPIGVGGTASSSRSARRSLSGGANTSSSSMQNSRAASPSPSLLLTGSIASFDVEPRQPILNVRLVRGVSRGRSSRSRVRVGSGRHGEEGGREMHVDNGDSPDSEPTHVDSAAVDPDNLKPPRPLDDPPQWAGDQDASGVSFFFSYILIFQNISHTHLPSCFFWSYYSRKLKMINPKRRSSLFKTSA